MVSDGLLVSDNLDIALPSLPPSSTLREKVPAPTLGIS